MRANHSTRPQRFAMLGGCLLALVTTTSVLATISVALTADTEGTVGPCSTCPGSPGGLVRRAGALKQLRAQSPDLLLVDAGNALFGPESLSSHGGVIVTAYEALGYDAVNLCYRDFRYGRNETLALVQSVGLVAVSANILDERTGEPLVDPFVVRDAGGERIAFIGITQVPAELARLPELREQLRGLRVQSPEAALRRWVPKAKARADRLFLLYYGTMLGLQPIRDQFAADFDAILVGGVPPEYLPGNSWPPLVAAGAHGRTVAHLELETTREQTRLTQMTIDDAFPQDERIQRMLTAYASVLKPAPAAVRSAPGPVASEPSPAPPSPEGSVVVQDPETRPPAEPATATSSSSPASEPAVAVADKQPATTAPTGIELVPGSEGDPALAWSVYDASGNRAAARRTWGFAPLPAGVYRVELRSKPFVVNSGEIHIEPGLTTTLTPADLGMGRLQIELPAAANVRLASGSPELMVELACAGAVDKVRLRAAERRNRVVRWVPHGPVLVRWRSGDLTLEIFARSVRDEIRTVSFEPEILAAKHNLCLFNVTFGAAAGTGDDSRLVLVDPAGPRMLALASNPSSETLWLAPAGTVARGRLGDLEQVIDQVPIGTRSTVRFHFSPVEDAQAAEPELHLDIIIESPPKDGYVEGDLVDLIGRVSTAGAAGAARIVLVIDVSGSTEASSGADLDGDGQEDNILQAELAAAHLLLEKLIEIEDQGPGTAFKLAIVRFSGRGEVMAPMTSMSDPEGVNRLRATLDRIDGEGIEGGTDFVAALDQATEALAATADPGPAFILFMTDGKPSVGRAGIRELAQLSIEAAVRAGRAGAVIHTFGLGGDFHGEISPALSYPPAPTRGVDILAAMASSGEPGGLMTALPRPADVVEIIPHLPVLELPELEVDELRVINTTTGEQIDDVRLFPDGSFQAQVPVSLLPHGDYETNTLSATAVAFGDMTATAEVTVRSSIGVIVTHDPPSDNRPILFVLDASGSMMEEIGGVPRLDIARDVIRRIIEHLPEGSLVGLRVYGHRYNTVLHRDLAPTDSELVVPMKPLHRAEFLHVLRSIRARGGTPLAYTIQQTPGDIHGVDRPRVVLITDGVESFRGRPAAAAKVFAAARPDAAVAVVGFAIGHLLDREQLTSIALAAGGSYFDAADAGSLLGSIKRALNPVVSYRVVDESGHELIQGWFGDWHSLPSGRYVCIFERRGQEWRLPFELAPGAEVQLECRVP